MDEMEILAAERVRGDLPSMESVRFTSSGAEANLAMLRIARAWTGRKRVVKSAARTTGGETRSLTDLEVRAPARCWPAEFPSETLANTVLVYQNDLDALERTLAEQQKHGGVAAVVCEPLGAESGLVPLRRGLPRPGGGDRTCARRPLCLRRDRDRRPRRARRSAGAVRVRPT